ncbi:hypothetical protein EDB19DRAFT_1271818 [Suillus lakei]|nr:hypothetical protein EDB19DRAFT_1271818 [Suillus lakei]
MRFLFRLDHHPHLNQNPWFFHAHHLLRMFCFVFVLGSPIFSRFSYMDVDYTHQEPQEHEHPLSATPLPPDPLPHAPLSPLAAMPSPSSPYLRVISSPRPRPISVMRTSQVPFGSPIPVAHSIPALVPRQIQRADLDAEAQNAQHTVARTTVGLYDDPDAGDNLHNDPLLHTVTELNGDSESDNDTHRARVLRTPANSQHRQFQVPTPLEYEAPPSAAQLYRDSHTEWFGRLVLLLVAVLHAKHRVSFRACALILFTLNTILLALNVLQPTNPLPITLHTIINRFDLQDHFTIYPICGSCHRIFPIDAPIDTLCSDCDSRLFKPISDRLFRRITGR